MSWFLVNILLPLILPLVGIVGFMLLPIPPTAASNLKMITLFKDGQLCWAALAMGMSTLYETVTEAHRHPNYVIYILLIACLMLLSMLLAAGGAVFSTSLWSPPSPRPSGKERLLAWCNHYRTFVGSFVLCAITAFAYTILHFGVVPIDVEKGKAALHALSR
jgi:hypothetical protein